MTTTTNLQLAQQIVNFLNDLLRLSPDAIYALVEHRVPCTKELADHPTVQIIADTTSNIHTVGLLGILNGLCGRRSTGGGFIAAVVNTETNQIEQFRLLEDNNGTT